MINWTVVIAEMGAIIFLLAIITIITILCCRYQTKQRKKQAQNLERCLLNWLARQKEENRTEPNAYYVVGIARVYDFKFTPEGIVNIPRIFRLVQIKILAKFLAYLLHEQFLEDNIKGQKMIESVAKWVAGYPPCQVEEFLTAMKEYPEIQEKVQASLQLIREEIKRAQQYDLAAARAMIEPNDRSFL